MLKDRSVYLATFPDGSTHVIWPPVNRNSNEEEEMRDARAFAQDLWDRSGFSEQSSQSVHVSPVQVSVLRHHQALHLC